jgi:hypothetical protein
MAPKVKASAEARQRELQHQRAQGFGMLDRGVVLGRVEGGVRDADRGSETSDCKRTPLVGRHFRFFAARHGVQQAIAK